MIPKSIYISLIISILFTITKSQPHLAFKDNETLEYLAYYGFIDGGYATLKVKEYEVNGKKYFYAIASGYSIGIADKLFKVRDAYETYVSQENWLPIKAIRNIAEGSYRYYDEVIFDRTYNRVFTKRKGIVEVPENTMDILSAFYYARNFYFKNIKKGDIITIQTYFDDGLFLLQVRCKGFETIKTKLGKINCILLSPVVEPGRIFDTQDDVKIWISNDGNFIPIRVQFDLLVGSIKCDLVKYENLKYKLNVVK